MAKYPGVSPSVTRRLPRYYRYLEDLMGKGVERISSREFAEMIGLTASQIRQDLNCFGGFGQQGYGYNVAALHAEISKILSLDNNLPIILIGAGNLGVAITNHLAFENRGFRLVGIFDNNPAVIGKTIRNLQVRDVAEIRDFCTHTLPRAAILCVPKAAAAEMSETLYQLGVRGFWNFSHYDISVVHPDVVVENVHLGDSLMTLSFHVNELSDQPE